MVSNHLPMRVEEKESSSNQQRVRKESENSSVRRNSNRPLSHPNVPSVGNKIAFNRHHLVWNSGDILSDALMHPLDNIDYLCQIDSWHGELIGTDICHALRRLRIGAYFEWQLFAWPPFKRAENESFSFLICPLQLKHDNLPRSSTCKKGF